MRLIAFFPRSRMVLGVTITAILQAASLAAIVPGSASDTPAGRVTLKGIRAVRVEVDVYGAETETDGLTKDQLQSDVELRLRKAGITVNRSAAEVLNVAVHAYKSMWQGGGYYSFALSVRLVQPVALTRDPGIIAWGETWSTGGIGGVGPQQMSRYVRDGIADGVDRFINAFLEQNPKR